MLDKSRRNAPSHTIRGNHRGWLLPDALLALSLVALTLLTTNQAVTQLERRAAAERVALQRARDQRDVWLLHQVTP